MFDIRNVATSGFDRAIIAMRRDHGGREVSDSNWIPDGDDGFFVFLIGEHDIEECSRAILAGNRDFLKFITVWAHIEAPAKWWSVYGGYFIARSDVARHGDMMTLSVMTTYVNLRNLAEVVEETAGDWRLQNELHAAFAGLPESWMILPKVEKKEG